MPDSALRSTSLDRLAERAPFASSRVPAATSEAKTFHHFTPFFLPSRPPLIPFNELCRALEACFESFEAVNTDELLSGEMGLQLVVHALKRVDFESMKSEEEEVMADWISALAVQAGVQARRHPLEIVREAAPEPEVVDKKVPLRKKRAIQVEEDEEDLQDIAPVEQRRRPRSSTSALFVRPASPESLVDEEEAPKADKPQRRRNSAAPLRSASASLSKPTPPASASSGLRKAAPKAANQSSSASKPPILHDPPKKRLRPRASSAPSTSEEGLPTSASAPNTPSEWVKAISLALNSLPISTGTLAEIINALKRRQPAIDSIDRLPRKITRYLTGYMCYQQVEDKTWSNNRDEVKLWTFVDEWKASGLNGSAMKWEVAEGESDDQLWCWCKEKYDRRDMIQCSKASCATTWYHHTCVGCPDEMCDPEADWTCPQCL